MAARTSAVRCSSAACPQNRSEFQRFKPGHWGGGGGGGARGVGATDYTTGTPSPPRDTGFHQGAWVSSLTQNQNRIKRSRRRWRRRRSGGEEEEVAEEEEEDDDDDDDD